MIQKGSCHCGKIGFSVEGEFDSVLECNCSHCSRKGYLLWFVPMEKFTLKTPESELSTYTFNKHVIKHHFCSKCGCAPFGFGTDPKTGGRTAAINIRCLEGIDLSSVKRIPFNGKS
ncbi:MAG TPA: GFA family protein, partial [Candidatus Nanoarchaeia archaeon]|nr:GFA family protein [Candidatus Nanoarchaeia archaeon]